MVTDTSLTPPDMVALLDYTNTFTNLDVGIMRDFLGASSWNASTMSFLANDTMVDFAGGGRVTLLVPLDDALESTLTVLERRRLGTSVWSRHLYDMLSHMILPRVYTQDELRQEAETAGGFSQVENFAGTFIPLELSSSSLSIGDGILQDPSLSAIDG